MCHTYQLLHTQLEQLLQENDAGPQKSKAEKAVESVFDFIRYQMETEQRFLKQGEERCKRQMELKTAGE